TNMTAHAIWVAGTWIGLTAGYLIADVKPLALDYALPALFVALLAFQIKDRVTIIVALLAGFAAVALSLTDLARWSVIIAALLAATTGVLIEQWTKKRSS
ncbi:MAG: branched-chain amino acid ABC transporter permease, partial [Deltaproteobacteria bacterium]|nr:branched-chain amino acid ABC transporter permease [Deltaproteobacteria bacterium]